MAKPILQPHPEDRPYLRRLSWTVVIAAALLVIWRASDLLLLAFGAVLGAMVFISTGERLQRIGIRNAKLALGLAIALVLALLGFIVWLIAVQFGAQA